MLPDTLERWALPAPGQLASVDPNDCGLIGSYLRNGDKTERRNLIFSQKFLSISSLQLVCRFKNVVKLYILVVEEQLIAGKTQLALSYSELSSSFIS